MNYFDTSALLKRFTVEKGTPLVQKLLSSDQKSATATIAYAEVYGALSRKNREKQLTATQYHLTCRQFEEDWNNYVRVELRENVLRTARRLIQKYPLRGFDTIHLASALTLKSDLGEQMVFIAADDRLLSAAKSESLPIINPEKD
jgi:predicted nucleic acid-binding protein